MECFLPLMHAHGNIFPPCKTISLGPIVNPLQSSCYVVGCLVSRPSSPSILLTIIFFFNYRGIAKREVAGGGRPGNEAML